MSDISTPQTITLQGREYNLSELTVMEFPDYWLVNCPATGFMNVPRDGRWTFNGDYVRPTFQPSYNETWGKDGQSQEDFRRESSPNRNHCWIRDGKIEYLGDSTHSLRGTTVDIPPLGEGRAAMHYWRNEAS